MRTAALISACILLAACKHAKQEHVPPRADTIPRISEAITLDGELHEPAWNARAFRAVLSANGEQARPYSELRLLHDDKNLYVGLYAADEDIRSTDQWELTVNGRALHYNAAGKGDFSAGVDRDGTIDKPDDFDEEWVIETAIPLPAAPVAIAAKRCDTLKDGSVRCGEWQGTLALE
jgi:hypothetical protein